MTFPQLSEAFRISRLAHPGRKLRMVLDTDTYNEIDDQFALTYALLSPEQMSVEAIYAAPFHNTRSDGPGDGMEKSYPGNLCVCSTSWVIRPTASPSAAQRNTSAPIAVPQDNDAVRDLIEKALASAR